jgi:hypothetical protein
VADGGEFPVEDGDDPWFGGVKDLFNKLDWGSITNEVRPYKVVKFVISVDDGITVAAHVLADKVDHLVEILVRPAQRSTGLDVFDHGLLGLDARKRVAVARVEARLLAVALQADRVRVDRVKPGQGFNGRTPTVKTCEQTRRQKGDGLRFVSVRR